MNSATATDSTTTLATPTPKEEKKIRARIGSPQPQRVRARLAPPHLASASVRANEVPPSLVSPLVCVSTSDTPTQPNTSQAWLIRLALRTCALSAIQRKECFEKPNKYYRGAMPTFVSLGPLADAAPISDPKLLPAMTGAWKRCFERATQPWHFSTAKELIKRVVQDERAVVVKLAFRRMVNSAWCTMSLHTLDLDVNLSDEDKKRLGAWLRKNKPSLRELFEEFPAFEVQFNLAQRLVKAAIDRGATDAFAISTGCKGYRVCIQTPVLYVKVKTSDLGSRANHKRAFLPTLSEYFGVATSAKELNDSLDWSVWGDNLGVRSNLHPHAVTLFHPLVLIDGLIAVAGAATTGDLKYGAASRDAPSYNRLTALWEYIFTHIPEDPEKDWVSAATTASVLDTINDNRKTGGTRKKVASPVNATNERCLIIADDDNDAANEVHEVHEASEDNEVHKATVEDNFDDIKEYLAQKGWAAQQSSFDKAQPGARFITVALSKSRSTEPFICPIRGREHTHNNGAIRFDRSLGLLQLRCLNDKICEPAREAAVEEEWLTMSDVSPGANELLKFLVHHRDSKKNHMGIANLIAPHTKRGLAYDTALSSPGATAWRIYEAHKGTWRKVNCLAEALRRLHEILNEQIAIAHRLCQQHATRFERGSTAREGVPIKLLEKFSQECGTIPYLTNLATASQAYLSIDGDHFKRYFMGYLPLANCMIHFDAKTGRCVPLDYKPEQYVRQEYQSDVSWNGSVRAYQPVNVATAVTAVTNNVRAPSTLSSAKTWLLMCQSWKKSGVRDVPSSVSDIIVQHLLKGNRKLELQFARLRMEAILNQWWTPEERPCWLEMAAYGMSRTAFAEVFFIVEGRPGSAKSSFSQFLQQMFGANNVLIQNCNLIASTGGAQKHDSDGNAHTSNMMACFDKAIVFNEEPAANMFFRQQVIKSLSGNTQSGRGAHNRQVETSLRSFLMVVVGNVVPLPEDPSDDAFKSRPRWITATKVFVRSPEHKKRLLSQLTPEQIKTTVWIDADKVKLEAVLIDPDCQAYFVALLADAWSKLVATQKRQFTTSQIAKHRLESYFQSSRNDQNTAFSFFESMIKVRNNSHFPKRSLYAAYEKWFGVQCKLNGLDKTEKLTCKAFLQTIKKATDHVHSVKEVARTTWVLDDYSVKHARGIGCFVGISIVDELYDFIHDESFVVRDSSASVTDSQFCDAFKGYLDFESYYGKCNEKQLLVQAYYRICDSVATGGAEITLKGEDTLVMTGIRLARNPKIVENNRQNVSMFDEAEQ